MNEKECILKEIPVLIVYDDLEKAAKKGCVLFFHGLTSSKEEHISELYNIAEDGYVAVGVDNYGHGKRKLKNFEKIFTDENPNIERDFLDAVMNTASDVPILIDELKKHKYIKTDNIGIAGVSMGGYITYTAITVEPRVKVAAAIIGSPRYKLDMKESPHNNIGKFSHVKLLSQNASKDTVVLAEFARKFHEELKDKYADYEQRFEYIEYPNSEHMMELEDWELSIKNLRDWFKKHLN